MELEFERDTLQGYDTVAELTLCQEETLESIVPDACPDILRIVDVCGQAMLHSKQIKAGAVELGGMVRAVILYEPDGGAGLRRMEVGLPFRCQAEAPGLTEQGRVLARPRLRCAEARALNSRKVLLRVDLAVDVTACQPTEQPLCRGVLDPEKSAVCQRCQSQSCGLLSAVEEKPFTFSQRVRLPAGQGEPPQVMALWAETECGECKRVGAKLIFKGEAELHMLLQEPGGGLTADVERLPFSQVLEVPEGDEAGDSRVWVEVTDVSYQAETADPRELQVELELLAQAQLRCSRTVTLLQDLYSTAWQTQLDHRPLALQRLGPGSIRPQAARELLETGESVRSVADSRLAIGQVSQNREGEQLVLTAEAWLTVLYQDGEDRLQCVHRTVPVTCRLDCPEGCRCLCTVRRQGEVYAAPAAGGVEVRFTLEFDCLPVQTLSVPAVCGGSLGEARGADGEKRPSVVLRFAAPGEEVWDIAKAYGATTAQILQANELEEETLPAGRMLLIPNAR